MSAEAAKEMASNVADRIANEWMLEGRKLDIDEQRLLKEWIYGGLQQISGLIDDLFYSLGDLYLVQCMEKYPEDPIAKDCFESYLEDMEFIYITKKKKEFPKDIVKKIEGYKKLVKYTEPLE